MVSKCGVLLLQLGTPDAPTPTALRRYLRQFLSDRRVVDLSPPLWWFVLNFMVLPRRPARSARLYRRIWTKEGSPLAVTTEAQARALEVALTGAHGDRAPLVAAAMRYGRPSITEAIEDLLGRGCDRLLLFPMYPQYASATTGSSVQEVLSVLAPRRVVPAIRVVPPYFSDPAYVDALVGSSRPHLEGAGDTHLVMSFHGIPRRYASMGDPYPDHCQATAHAFLHASGWPARQFTLSYQSLFGREEWLRPYTDETLATLARLAESKPRRVAVMCPGFTADCLETLEEINMAGRELYHAAGGDEFCFVPCLNTHPDWIGGMRSIVERELAGWM